ncbi:MAG: hypothetical protein V4443_09120 [Pseudomonadota bacterium]
MSIPSKIKRWYLGGPLPIREENNGSTTTRLPNTFEPSVSAQFAQYIVKHFPGFIAAVFAAAVALFIYFDSKAGNGKPHSEKTSSIYPIVVVHTSNLSFERDSAKTALLLRSSTLR